MHTATNVDGLEKRDSGTEKDDGLEKDVGTENQRAQEKTCEKDGPDETPFGPWVIVARKRKPGKGEKKTLKLQPNPVMLIIARLGPSAHRAHQWVLLQQA